MYPKTLLQLIILLVTASISAFAQTVTVNCTGITGSYKSGSVTSTGVKGDGNMLVNNVAGQNTPRGWAVFDLSSISIPAGAVISAASLNFSYITSANGTSVTCNLYGYTGDISTGTGTALYNSCVTGTSFNSTNWGSNSTATPVTINKAFNAAGITFIQSSLTGLVSITFVASSGSNQYTITGYGGTAVTQPQLSITYQLPCSGTPAAGTAASSATNACSGASFSLSSTGGSTASGLIYQWESSPPGMGTWSIITGATTANYTVTGGQTAATDYHLVVTCPNGGGSSTSNIVSVGMSSFFDCYCPPGTTDCTADDYIANVNFAGINQSSACGNTSTGYSNYKTSVAPAAVMQGTSYPISVTVGNGGTEHVGIWIDYDHNAVFDVTEFTTIGSGNGTTITNTIAIPLTALTGITGMRVRLRYSTAVASTATCNAYTYGETEDYLIDIAQNTNCSGTPTAGTATSPAGTCAGVPFTITLAGNTNASGISIQWEYFDNGTSSWQQITGATTSTLSIPNQVTSTDYRAVVVCSFGGGSSTSNAVTVIQNPPTQCYCQPAATDPTASDHITNANFAGINNSTGAGNANGYNNYTASVAAGIVSPGLSYPISMSIGNGGTEHGAVWIDWDQSGTFDVGEFTNMGSGNSAPTLNQTIAVPVTAALGSTRIRFRSKYNATLAATDPCAGYTYGETEDYMINIIPPPSCPAPSVLTATNISATSVDLGWTNNSTATSFTIEYGLQGFTPGTGSLMTTSNNPVTLSGLTQYTNYTFYVRAKCSSSDSSIQTGPFNFTTLLQNDIPSGAFTLTVNAGCSGTPYSNNGGTQSTGEPFAGCRQTNGFHSVWFKFIAPASGFVRVSNDYAGATIGNTRIGVFSTLDSSNFTTFTLLACDDNNAVAVTGKSLLYVNGLTPGVTYYVDVDGLNNNQATGTFCVTVDEMVSSMLSSGGACVAGHAHASQNTSYMGWLSLVDNSGKLIANVRQTNATSSPTNYTISINTNSATVRQSGNQYYLDRNYLITSSGSPTTPSFDVQYFFPASELSLLQAVDAAATLNNLNVTRQTGSTCAANYTVSGGANSVLMQNSNGSVNGVSWVQAVSPGFSNFYLMSGAVPLIVRLKDITAMNEGSRNRVDWETVHEDEGDIMTLEKSDDGKSFTTMTSIESKGEASKYHYWDETPFEGTNYYRLRMDSKNGTSTHSKIVSASLNKTGGFVINVYPNPFTDVLALEITDSKENNAAISIIDVTGKIIKTVTISESKTFLDLGDISPGVYLIKYSDDKRTKSIRITKRN